MQFISSPIAAAIERAQTRAGEQAIQDREYLAGIALARTMFAQQLIDEADYREAECLLFLRFRPLVRRESPCRSEACPVTQKVHTKEAIDHDKGRT